MNEAEILALLDGAKPDVRIGFILTEEGRMWNAEGLREATDKINELYPPKNKTASDGILWSMGIALNDPVFLAGLLEKRPDAFIVVSMSPNSPIMPNADGLGGNDYAAALRTIAEDESCHYTSWEIMCAIVEKYSTGDDET